MLFIKAAVAAAALAAAAPGEKTAGAPYTVESIRARYNGETAIRSEVRLHIFWKVREKEETKKGSIQIAPGNRFRVVIGDMTWVSDGEVLWQYGGRTAQAVVRALDKLDLSVLPASILSTYISGFRYSIAEENAERAVLQWQPDSLADKINASSIELTLDKKKGVVSRAVITVRGGTVNTYTFTGTKFGGSFAPETFIFTFPDGADIHDERDENR
jgi:outer membrane lipoprotein-sorting protein